MDTVREVQDNTSCTNVFLCKQGSHHFVELARLCDGKEDCGEEKSLCQSAQFKVNLNVSPLKIKGNSYVSYCLPGMATMNRLAAPCVQEIFTSPDHPVFGAKSSAKVILPNISMSCEHVFGETSVFLNCLDRCFNSICKLTPITRDSCSKSSARVSSVANNSYITVVLKSNKGYRSGFLCSNDNCVSYEKVCNLANDCGDYSDEANCSNSFQCKTSKLFIPQTSKCDGVIDCKDNSDECNTQCNKEIISANVLKVFAWFFGGIAICLNIISLWRAGSVFREGNRLAKVNKIVKIMISIGDLTTGVYLMCIAAIDTIFAKSYCKQQLSWLTSQYCAVLGILNTFGATMSIMSMTYLSIFRAVTIIYMRIELSEHFKLINSISVIAIVFTSCIIACVPVLDIFEDLFVNGVTYDENIKFFIAATNKEVHLNLFESYYGKIFKQKLDWATIRILTSLMFSNDYGDLITKKVHFYGNEGVCLFKYFVKNSDPQRHFVWLNLALDFSCLLCISICYTIINVKTKKSGKALAMMMNRSPGEKPRNQNEQRLQQKITIIIMTDFFCWIPFIFICTFHSLEVLDATFLYSYSSILILSINSVINPLLYDEYMTNIVDKIFQATKFQIIEPLLKKIFRKENVVHVG